MYIWKNHGMHSGHASRPSHKLSSGCRIKQDKTSFHQVSKPKNRSYRRKMYLVLVPYIWKSVAVVNLGVNVQVSLLFNSIFRMWSWPHLIISSHLYCYIHCVVNCYWEFNFFGSCRKCSWIVSRLPCWRNVGLLAPFHTLYKVALGVYPWQLLTMWKNFYYAPHSSTGEMVKKKYSLTKKAPKKRNWI